MSRIITVAQADTTDKAHNITSLFGLLFLLGEVPVWVGLDTQTAASQTSYGKPG